VEVKCVDDTLRSESIRTEWDRVAASPQFKLLLRRKKMFIIPAFVFFFVYYLALPVSIGYAPGIMTTQVFGAVNLAYLFALSQFVVGWGIAWAYLRVSAKFDKLIKEMLPKQNNVQGDS
jgi:uncharacterized membrane protein (DUF485 family)